MAMHQRYKFCIFLRAQPLQTKTKKNKKNPVKSLSLGSLQNLGHDGYFSDFLLGLIADVTYLLRASF